MVENSPGGSGDEIRASDAERDAVAGQLGRHLEDGRLTIEEYSERLERVYAARTRGELARLTRDLPAVAPPPPPRPPLAHRMRSLAGLATPSVIAVGLWGAAGGHGSFWPAWVMVVSLLIALRRFRRGGGTAPFPTPLSDGPSSGPDHRLATGHEQGGGAVSPGEAGGGHHG